MVACVVLIAHVKRVVVDVDRVVTKLFRTCLRIRESKFFERANGYCFDRP